MIQYSFDDLKVLAREAGYNLDTEKFRVQDWPYIQAYGYFKKHIKSCYCMTLRDIIASAYSPFDPHAKFKMLERNKAENGYSFVEITLHAGINYGEKETITVDAAVPVQLIVDDKIVEGTSFEYDYSTQDKKIYLRYQSDKPISFVISSPTFQNQYVEAGAEFTPAPDKEGAIAGIAVVGLSTVGLA